MHSTASAVISRSDLYGLMGEALALELLPCCKSKKPISDCANLSHVVNFKMVYPRTRGELVPHWKHACRLLLQQASTASLTRQVHVALFMDGKLDADAFEHMSSARRWRRHAAFTSRQPLDGHVVGRQPLISCL
jgi:hypothetical protein